MICIVEIVGFRKGREKRDKGEFCLYLKYVIRLIINNTD